MQVYIGVVHTSLPSEKSHIYWSILGDGLKYSEASLGAQLLKLQLESLNHIMFTFTIALLTDSQILEEERGTKVAYTSLCTKTWSLFDFLFIGIDAEALIIRCQSFIT